MPTKAKQSTKGFLLRLDPSAMEEVERWAASEFRSVNGQLQWIVNDALRRYRRLPKDSKSADTDENHD